MRVLLASRNAGKLREFHQLLPGLDLVPWPAQAPDIPEEGAFFQDNALQKATFARAWWAEHGTEPVAGPEGCRHRLRPAQGGSEVAIQTRSCDLGDCDNRLPPPGRLNSS